MDNDYQNLDFLDMVMNLTLSDGNVFEQELIPTSNIFILNLWQLPRHYYKSAIYIRKRDFNLLKNNQIKEVFYYPVNRKYKFCTFSFKDFDEYFLKTFNPTLIDLLYHDIIPLDEFGGINKCVIKDYAQSQNGDFAHGTDTEVEKTNSIHKES